MLLCAHAAPTELEGIASNIYKHCAPPERRNMCRYLSCLVCAASINVSLSKPRKLDSLRYFGDSLGIHIAYLKRAFAFDYVAGQA